MPKKKKISQEEIQKEIDRQVAEAKKVWIEERMYKSEKHAMEKCLNELAYAFKFEYLSLTYALSVGKFMIDSSRLSDEDKELMGREFGNSIVGAGSRGVTEDEWHIVQEAIDAIVQKLQGLTRPLSFSP